MGGVNEDNLFVCRVRENVEMVGMAGDQYDGGEDDCGSKMGVLSPNC